MFRSLVSTGDDILPLSVPLEGLEANYSGEDFHFYQQTQNLLLADRLGLLMIFILKKIITLLETLVEFLLFLSCPLAWE